MYVSMPIDTTWPRKADIGKDLWEAVTKGNTKVTVLKDISFAPVYRLAKGYEE